MTPFLSCDWGTTSFRLSLVNAENFDVIEISAGGDGILATYNQWNEKHNGDPGTRISFYLDIVHQQIGLIEKKISRSLNGMPLIISGMASSSIGMMPLPYQQLPIAMDGSSVLTEFLPGSTNFLHDTLLISGVASGDDVMRGEETQLIGMLPSNELNTAKKLFILPGTHSKHIVVENSQATAFRTYMTGEFFDLLSKKSILHAGLQEADDLEAGHSKEVFQTAVKEGSRNNLLNICFRVRTNSLFDKLGKTENYFYLSGLLIGAELGEIPDNDTIEIYLCCGSKLKLLYETALEALGLTHFLRTTSPDAIEKAAMRGQYKIYEKYLQR